jgi:hypothetical protein
MKAYRSASECLVPSRSILPEDSPHASPAYKAFKAYDKARRKAMRERQPAPWASLFLQVVVAICLLAAAVIVGVVIGVSRTPAVSNVGTDADDIYSIDGAGIYNDA